MRQVFIDKLPKKKNSFNWEKSIGYIVNFVYDNINGKLEIVNYQKGYLFVRYNKITTKIFTGSFTNGRIGCIIGKKTKDFKIDVGQAIKDEKRNIIITNREYRKDNKEKQWKWYKYTCNVCGWTEGWTEELALLKEHNCACCTNKKVVQGINDITTTNPEMICYFQGGYDEAKLYTYGSNEEIYPICPNCGRIKDKKMKIYTIYKQHSIGCTCSDGHSYPEKFICSLLEQININFIYQATRLDLSWCNNYRYDFYFEWNNESYIIETHQLQHYKDKTRDSRRTFNDEQNIDNQKKELALKNNINHYIILDCRKSELEWIKNSVMDSKLPNLLYFKEYSIDWLKCNEFACSNLVKAVCNYKKSNPEIMPSKIAKIFKIAHNSTINYLKQGVELGWCYYNPKESRIKSTKKNGRKNGKEVEIFKDGIPLGKFPSCAELSRQSEKLFGVKLIANSISSVCQGKQKMYKDFMFKYIIKY